MGIKVIITGSTGMVGEGVLLKCLEHPAVEKVLIVNRRHYDLSHPKLSELIMPDFFSLEEYSDKLKGFDACFFCAGKSSIGMSEKNYFRVTYEMTMHFAGILARLNPGMVLDYVSGAQTDSTEKGRLMWARIKGKTENDLIKLPFRGVYNFRPGFMKPSPGQKNINSLIKLLGGLYPILHALFPNYVNTLDEVGLAMINSVIKGYPKHILEIEDIRLLARE
ncbi:MAG: epimerase [Ignavibacteria bacterium]|nr:epimerase [Ignavibacteria bacterium]MCU7502921.1 epimerase [Ignavibacteria bacterium]MCU7515585.1 epimerase [Ignavibacteria bacterium]